MAKRGKGLVLIPMAILCSGLAAPAQDSPAGPPEKTSSVQAASETALQHSSRVSGEMVSGKLNPATSKPGDEIAVRLDQDVKSEGQVLLKKGSIIKGVVHKVQRTDGKGEAKGTAAAQSMMQLEWIAPPGLSGSAANQLNVALQSVAFTNPLYAHQLQEESGNSVMPTPQPAAAPVRSASGGVTGGLGGTVGGAVSSVTTVGAGVAGASSASVGAVGQSSSALAMPRPVLPPSPATSAALQQNFGISGNQLFQVGSGQATSAGGTTSSMDLFSHMSNDTVITSPHRDFEIGSGAQMQLLIQSNRSTPAGQ